MYTNDTKDKFVELRAAGHSFGRISEQLGVAKSTLHHWEDERADDIARLRRIYWEELEHSWGRNIEELMTELNIDMLDCETRLHDFTRNLNNLSLRDTVMLLRESRREYFRLRAILMGTPSRARKCVPASGADSTTQRFNASTPPQAKPNKTERYTQTEPTGPLITNDLQQSEPESFDSCPGLDAASPPPVSASQLSGENPSEEPNKTERFTQNGPTESLITNDLQQSKSESFDFPEANKPLLQTDSTVPQFNDSTPVPAPSTLQLFTPSTPEPAPDSTGPRINDSTEFIGSVVINPLECGRAVWEKCLQAEREQRATASPAEAKERTDVNQS